MIHGSLKIFRSLLFAIFLFGVSGLFAEPIFDVESELSQAVGKKRDEQKNPISKFLLHSKTKIQQSIKKLKKIKDENDDPFSAEFGNDTIDTLQFSSNLQFVNASDEKSARRTDVPKVDHAPEIINRISGDSLKSLGMGTPVYCALAGVVSHSGIAMGDKIVHLDGDGIIIFTSPQEFIDRLSGNNPAVNIYYAAYDNNTPLEIDFAALRAMSAIGKKFKYNVVKKNCHGFTIWCFTGKYSSVLSINSYCPKFCEKHLMFSMLMKTLPIQFILRCQ